MLVLYMIEIFPLLGKYKYDTWRILPVKYYIDNSMRLWSCIRNVNTYYKYLYAKTKSQKSPHRYCTILAKHHEQFLNARLYHIRSYLEQ
jgi:hypothetical protein